MSSEVPSEAVDETPQDSPEEENTPAPEASEEETNAAPEATEEATDAAPEVSEAEASESEDQEAAPEPVSSATTANSLDDITPKMKLTGTVKRTEIQGAIIDVGLERDGLLHISQLSDDPIKNVTDVVKEGDTVEVFVLAIDKKSGRLDLTLVEPPDLTWNEVKVNQSYTGVIERIENYGVFVNIGAERAGLIHVSELTTDYVSDPNEVVKVGQSIEAKVIGVNKRKKQIDLSMRALEMEEFDAAMEEEDAEPFATSMEMALRKALSGGEEDEAPAQDKDRKRRKKDRKKAKTEQQQEIFERTLRMHQNGQ